MKKILARLSILYLMTHLGGCQPGKWMAQSAQLDLLTKRQKGFASPQVCQQAFRTNRDASLTAAKVSLGFSLLLSLLVVGETLWMLKRTEQGRLILEKQPASMTRLAGAGAVLGLFMAFEGYQYYLGTKGIELTYQADLYKCR
jgi:hypothetical protein